ncbi:MAG TPA: transglycosylase SLT domain-containing protein [Terracidiphilus sp.]|nr:transglycosylase SLT domain-containing protein [Terracidiphilus sp.]
MQWRGLSVGASLSALAVGAVWLAGCGPSASKSASARKPPQAMAPAIAAPAAQPTAPATSAPSQSAAEQQRVRQLIQQVEAAYANGEADYRKGMLPEAKAQFDHAVDLMLSSGIDIRGNQQLSDEFDHIVDKVNALETEALKQGNGFAPQVEATPAEAASDVTFAVDPNLVAKATADLATTKSDLPLVMNDYVAAFINFFANSQRGHATLLHSFERAGRYRAMIQRVMAEEGVPQDLIYLAVAESGFQPRAVNRGSHAGGIWQFMPYGDYGLTRNSYVDERFDPEKSTRAYARYMKFLYNQLGDWYLAMAAYDWGAGNVQRAVEKTGYADFWELYKRHNLPGETQNYVPEILAAIIIANHPTQYGFDDVTLDPPVLTDTVTVNYSIDLRLVSDLVGAPVDEIQALNPSLLRMVTPPDASFDLHLPAGGAELFNQRVASIPESKRSSWRYHIVAAGDTVPSVAHEYHVQPEELASANQLTESSSLQGVDALVVPLAPEAAPSARRGLYTVRRGDTLVTIADRFGVSLAELRRWNNLTGIRVESGRRLHVAEPVAVQRVSSSGRRRHAPSSAGDPAPHTKSAATSRSHSSAASKQHAHSSQKASSAKKRSSHKRSDVAKSAAHK